MRTLCILLIGFPLLLWAQQPKYEEQIIYKTKFDEAIPVLNVATFHMGETTDAHATPFDKKDSNNLQAVKYLAQLLSAFQTTVIVIEDLPSNDSLRNIAYRNYLKNPHMKFENPTEIELLAYEIGRLCDVKRIYGIDYKESYDYNISVKENVDQTTLLKYWKLNEENEASNPEEGIPFYDLFKLNNHPQYLESLIHINADLLTYISSKGNHEGADEAAKFYHRNLVMFSNLNQIPTDENDRDFILMGGTHTAFLMDFLKRSQKYKVENVYDYMK